MKARRIGRAGAALATTIFVLAATASPASAAVHTGEVIAGTMTIDFSDPYPSMVSDLDDPVRPCIANPVRGNPPTLSLDFSAFPGNSATTATAMNLASQYVDLGFFGTPYWYELELRLLAPPPSGMYDTGAIAGTVMVQELALQVVWYRFGSGVDLDPEEPCPAKTPTCVGLSQLSLVGTWVSAPRLAALGGVSQLGVLDPFCSDPVIEEIFDASSIDISGMVIDF